MDYDNLIEKLNSIINKVKSKDSTAVNDFDSYLDEVLKIEAFSSSNIWDINWRLKVWEFGVLFSDQNKADASQFIEKLRVKKYEDNEGLSFIYSEMIWNFFGQNESFTKETFRTFLKKFLGNPEFYHSYGHYLINKKEYHQAILNYRKATDLEPGNDNYVNSLFACWSAYFSDLILKSKLDEAETIRREMLLFFSDPKFSRFWVFKNIAVGMKDRVVDHSIIREKIDQINELINKRIDGVRSQLVNVVSLITAVIGYLLIGTNIVLSTKPIRESFLMMFGLGIVIIIFVIVINYQFKPVDRGETFWKFLKHRQFWAIVVLILILLITYKCL